MRWVTRAFSVWVCFSILALAAPSCSGGSSHGDESGDSGDTEAGAPSASGGAAARPSGGATSRGGTAGVSSGGTTSRGGAPNAGTSTGGSSAGVGGAAEGGTSGRGGNASGGVAGGGAGGVAGSQAGGGMGGVAGSQAGGGVGGVAGSQAGGGMGGVAGSQAGGGMGGVAGSYAGGGAGGAAGSQAGGGSGGIGPLPTRVLISNAHSGFPREGANPPYGKHDIQAARYQAAGLTVDYTATWPSSLAAYRLIVLIVPGYLNKTDFFLDPEIVELGAFVGRGGILYVQNEYPLYAGTPVINDLLTRLGSTLLVEDVQVGQTVENVTDLVPHPLFAGIDVLGFATSSRVIPGSRGVVMARVRGDVIMAAEASGTGWIVLAGDDNILDDFALTTHPPRGADNFLFCDRLASLP